MNLSRASVARPVLTSMIAWMVVVVGLVATWSLPIDLLPDIETPTISIETNYAGASPEVVERLVTQIVENAVAVVSGVQELTSLSAEGTSSVRVTFSPGTDLDAATNDVRDRLDREADELPRDAERPQIRKFDISAFPVVILGVSSELDPVALTTFVETHVQHRFERLPGVASADLFGEWVREIHVALDPEALRALDLPLDQVVAALRDANVDLPAGELIEGRYEISLRVPGEFRRLEDLEETVVARRDGRSITLRQVGAVIDTHEDRTRVVRVNGGRGLRMGIRKQAAANTVEVSEAVRRAVAEVDRDLAEVEVVTIIDQGGFIERSISNVAWSVLYGGALALAVLMFFLRDARTTAVIGIAIPISILATMGLIALQGLTLNLMTLGGLALGVGLMVDNSIVVVENVYRRVREEGEGIRDAAVNGAWEVATPLLASTLTTVVIFLPLAFVQGISGRLFRDLAIVVVLALAASLVVALALVPMLSSRWMRVEAATATGAVGRLARMERALSDGYGRVLGAALSRRAAVVAVAAALVVLAGLGGLLLGTEFLPPSDEGEVRITGQMEVGTRLDLVDRQTRRIEAIVADAVPEAVATVTSVGPSGRRPDEVAQGELQVFVGAARGRDRSNTEIAADLRRRLDGQVPGMSIRVRAPQGQFILERILGGDDGLTVEVRGFDFDTLTRLAEQVVAVVAPVPGITDVRSSRAQGVPQHRLDIDRAKAASLGLSVGDVARVMQTAVAGTRAGEYRTEGLAHPILVRLADARHRTLDEILDLTLTGEGGAPVALRNVVTVVEGRGPILIERQDQQRRIQVSANVSGRDLGSVARDVRAALETIPRPVGYDLVVGGNVEEQQSAFSALGRSLLLSLVLVYMVLAGQYESYRDPLVVMVSVPAAAVGVVLTLLLTGDTLNIQSGIGCILLGGIVVNNAILIVDQASRLREAGMEVRAAVREAGRRRLRPVLMTTATTVLGLLPLALGIGEGADAQAPLARAVIGGLAASTAIVLLVVPVVYTLAHRDTSPAGAGASVS